MQSSVLLLRTGGTIDAAAYDDPNHPPALVRTLAAQESLVPQVVDGVLPEGTLVIKQWNAEEEQRLVKDSQLFDASDLALLAEVMNAAPQRCVVVTHGTDAMARNAMQLAPLLEGRGKTVVFAGAVVPLSMHRAYGSDGVGALQFALQGVDKQAQGVWVTGWSADGDMPQFFAPGSIEKDRALSLQRRRLIFTLR